MCLQDNNTKLREELATSAESTKEEITCIKVDLPYVSFTNDKA